MLRLDATLVGVNCCIFNSSETPYYSLAIKFLKGALKAWKPRVGSAGESGGRKGPAAVASGRKAQDYRTPERAPESDCSLYFREEDAAAGSTRRRQASLTCKGTGVAGMRASRGERMEAADEEDDDEEFVPTKRRSAAKSSKKRSRRGKDTGSDDDRSDDSDASWGEGRSGRSASSDEEPRHRAAPSTRAERAVARRAGARAKAGRAGERRNGRKRKRLAVSSGSEEESSEGEGLVRPLDEW